jgi:hypothetical protein
VILSDSSAPVMWVDRCLERATSLGTTTWSRLASGGLAVRGSENPCDHWLGFACMGADSEGLAAWFRNHSFCEPVATKNSVRIETVELPGRGG